MLCCIKLLPLVTFDCKGFFTMVGQIWLVPSVCYLVMYQIQFLYKGLLTVGSLIWFNRVCVTFGFTKFFFCKVFFIMVLLILFIPSVLFLTYQIIFQYKGFLIVAVLIQFSPRFV